MSLGLASFQDHLGMRLAQGNPLSVVACHTPVPQCVFSFQVHPRPGDWIQRPAETDETPGAGMQATPEQTRSMHAMM